jgi:hypothetical protein
VPVKLAFRVRVVIFHILMVLSSEPLASMLLLEKAKAQVKLAWPERFPIKVPVVVFHSLIVRSAATTANMLSLLKANAFTTPEAFKFLTEIKIKFFRIYFLLIN